VYKG